jgi:eukaryotic-like serine/threonine-protein kinase
MTTYTSEPGTRLGGRYRLEDRIAAGSGWAAWKAIDETLARAVTVFTFAPGFPRVVEVVTAARAASRLTDPRLAQVFDVEDTWDRAYIVMEWAAGDTLGDLLSQGPIEPYRAARMISEAAAALSSAHAAGVAHMCLSPGSVRWSQTGEVKVVGLGLDAALSGYSADDPVLADTQGLGRLLYAALTGHWPGQDYPALPPAPITDGQPCSPRQVVAGVPLDLSDLACRALALRTRDGAAPLTMPDQLARALVAALPPVPVPPVPPALPPRSGTARYSSAPGHDPYWPGEAGAAGAAGRSRWAQSADGAGWPDRERSDRPDRDWPDSDRSAQAAPRNGSWQAEETGHLTGSSVGGRLRRLMPATLIGGSASAGSHSPATGRSPHRRPPARNGLRSRLSAVSLAVVGVIVVATVAAFTLWPRHGGSQVIHPTTKQTSPATTITILRPTGATGFDPLTSGDSGNENTQYAHYAIDPSLRTAWQSQWYRSAQFGGLKTGSGLIIDMGKPVTLSSVTVTFGPVAGADMKLLVGSSNARTPANLGSMKTVATANDVTGNVTFHPVSSAVGRYLVIWFTRLPLQRGSHSQWMAEIFNVTVRGTG